MSVRALWIQVGLLFAVLYLALLWARPMITPDEARYGAMGADMLTSGDWLKLRMAGFTYYEKPPLGTWLIASSIACFGHNAFAIRLPCALAALTSALAAGMVARRATGRRELGPLTAMVQLTTLLPFLLGTVLVLDPIFTAFTSLTLAWFLAACQSHGRTRAMWLLASGAAAGLGFMTKGLLAFAIPGVAAAAFLCWERRWKDLCTMPWLPLLGAVLAGGPLALLLHRSEPGFWNYFIVVEHLRRFAAPDINQHPEPWWLLTVVLVGGSLFWLVHWPRVAMALRANHGWRTGIRFCLTWIVLPLALLSLSKGKLATYVLPLFPPVAALVAMGLVRWREGVAQSRDAGTTIAVLAVRVLALGAFLLALFGNPVMGLPRLWLGPEAPRWVLLGIALLTWSMLEVSSHRAAE
ncbi:MAG: phospholipid carrier-dependent glycosyltransferase, partial [Proteobacteria bacterium]|nr:phospholipid carrier-dependent glycosyltransferase [Pseudomonadota bacterium]